MKLSMMILALLLMWPATSFAQQSNESNCATQKEVKTALKLLTSCQSERDALDDDKSQLIADEIETKKKHDAVVEGLRVKLNQKEVELGLKPDVPVIVGSTLGATCVLTLAASLVIWGTMNEVRVPLLASAGVQCVASSIAFSF